MRYITDLLALMSIHLWVKRDSITIFPTHISGKKILTQPENKEDLVTILSPSTELNRPPYNSESGGRYHRRIGHTPKQLVAMAYHDLFLAKQGPFKKKTVQKGKRRIKRPKHVQEPVNHTRCIHQRQIEWCTSACISSDRE